MPQDYIPVAEYIRMSTEDQKYSLPNQQDAIRRYALEHGFRVSRTYADPGKSGVLIKHRQGLSQLLRDVLSGSADYKAIIVYDVSRWGRFQNPDEAAHYDFLCANAGIPVHYCAEQFSNDGSMQSSLMKAIKRTMAGEFSRELGVKVFDGLTRLVLQGFHAGALAPYGLERMLISPSGQRKGILKRGERKNLKTDKVVLVRGDRKEVECVREIFSLCAYEKKTSVQIAGELNARHLLYRDKPWTSDRVLRVLKSAQYLGLNVWAKRTQRLHSPSSLRPKSQWVTSKAPFEPIVDQKTFDKAQRTLADYRPCRDSEELLAGLRRVFLRCGRLSPEIIDRSKGISSSSTYMKRFGSLHRAYELVGYNPTSGHCAASQHTQANRSLRKGLSANLLRSFPGTVRIVRRIKDQKPVIEVDGQYKVSVLMCGMRPPTNGKSLWLVRLSPADRVNIALLCLLDFKWERIESYYLLPPILDSIPKHHCFHEEDFASGEKLKDDLSDFCDAVRCMESSADSPAADEYSD